MQLKKYLSLYTLYKQHQWLIYHCTIRNKLFFIVGEQTIFVERISQSTLGLKSKEKKPLYYILYIKQREQELDAAKISYEVYLVWAYGKFLSHQNHPKNYSHTRLVVHVRFYTTRQNHSRENFFKFSLALILNI